MPERELPRRASLAYLKKTAKELLALLRASDPSATLAKAQLEVARDHGFPSWRALKAEVDRRRAPHIASFFAACSAGDVTVLQDLLSADSSLARELKPDGCGPLHLAHRHPDALRLLLQHGADPNVRESGDNVSALHLAAANRVLESVQILLDAGADVHGEGDLHKGGVIGWAAAPGNDAVIGELLARGARHHIFSAMALNDLGLVQQLVEENPDCLLRRRSKHENSHTPVIASFAPPDGLGWLTGTPNYALMQLLIDLGADIEAVDDRGRTPLAIAKLRGDREAIRILRAAGAHELSPEPAVEIDLVDAMRKIATLAASVKSASPMFRVRDVRATIAWYESVGFTAHDLHEDSGELTYGRLTFGAGELTLSSGAEQPLKGVSHWFFTNRVEELYNAVKKRQAAGSDLRFDEDLYKPFYGGRQFSLRDPNELSLVFYQPD